MLSFRLVAHPPAPGSSRVNNNRKIKTKNKNENKKKKKKRIEELNIADKYTEG